MENYTHGKIVPVDIASEMRTSYLAYSMSVIVSRALPDVRDGLKPVHRRILYAMYEMDNTPDRPHKKSARPVADVMGKYHPHGDSAIYDTMVRLAQDFSIRYPLVDGHGNFGSVDGDPPAAMRYTEARLSKIAMEILRDIDKETVDFVPNYDNSLQEPQVLPARFPNLLANGSSGIAVGMATNIPPHNLVELIDGSIALLDNPDLTVADMMQYVKGPDFPTAGLIIGREGIKNAYLTGRGSIKVRAKARIERMANGKNRIIVSELPYQVNKARLIENIAHLVRDKKIDGITDLRDESDRDGMRIVIELRRDVNANILLNQLYAHTQMQTTFGAIMLALVNGEPKVLNLKEMLHYYVEHQKDVVTRRTRYELRKAEDRAHILEGLRIALNNIDLVIKIIRQSRNDEDAKNNLMSSLGLSDKQAQAILDMRLRRLTGLERDKIEEEYQGLLKEIARLQAILASDELLRKLIRNELEEIKQRYGDERRTEIVRDEGEMSAEDLIAEEDAVITLTHHGYIKRLPASTYKAQRRGGKGITAMGTKEEDFVENLFITTTHHNLLFFTSKGKVYKLKVHEITEASRTAKGTAIVNLLPVENDEKITAVIPVKSFENNELYMLMVTRHGVAKKTSLSEFEKIRKGGLIALSLDEDDDLIGVRLTSGDEEIILATRDGKAIRFPQTDIRAMGRTARGVKGITLEGDDQVVAMDVANDDADLLVITANGFGKRTPMGEYRSQGRGGKGILVMKRSQRNGPLVAMRVVREGDDVMMITMNGIIIRTEIAGISRLGRDTQGVTLMRLDEDDQVVAVAKVVSAKEEE